MKMLAVLRNFIDRSRAGFPEWTDTDYKSCRTSGLILLLFAATIVLPTVIIQIARGGGVFGDLWLVLVKKISGPDAGWVQMGVGFTLPGILAISLMGGVCVSLGASLLIWSRRFQGSQTSSTYVRQCCGHLLLCPLFFLVCAILCPLLPFPWANLGISNRAISNLRGLPFLVPFGLYLMEGLFVIPHALVVLFFGYMTLTVAASILSRGSRGEPSALATRAQGLDRIAKTSVHQWIDTDSKAYRSCGVVCFLFAAILVLPVVWFQVSTVLFRGGMTTVVDIWLTGGSQSKSSVVIPTLLMLTIAVGAATFAAVVGAKMFSKARLAHEETDSNIEVRLRCKRLLQRFAWLLLVIIPIATASTASRSISIVAQLNLSRLFATIDCSLWREARATSLWMQFCPLLLLGIVASVLTYCMLSPRQETPKLENNS